MSLELRWKIDHGSWMDLGSWNGPEAESGVDQLGTNLDLHLEPYA